MDNQDNIENEQKESQPQSEPQPQPEREVQQFSEIQLKIMEHAIKDILNGNDLNPINMANVVINCMNTASRFVSMSGATKKALVLRVIKEFINNSDLSAEAKQVLIAILDSTLNNMIDLLVSAAKGAFEFGKKNKKWFCCK